MGSDDLLERHELRDGERGEEALRLCFLGRHWWGEVTAAVTTATELDDKQTEALTETLRKAVGAKVAVELKVDPEILGGLVVRVGSRMFDSSLRTKLQRMQLAMKGIG